MMIRIFISYSHEDRALAEKVCAAIEAAGLEPLWDQGFAFGRGFHEQIKMFIAHAHVFLPIITESSSRRGWVHQEIGYAVALNIPVLPVAFGKLPDEMLHELHAVVLPRDEAKHADELQKAVTRASVDALLANYLDDANVLYETAPLSEDRAILMTRYANQVRNMCASAMLRQKGGLSSFGIPEVVINHPVWRERYGDQWKGDFHARCQRDERVALGHHAREGGFRIIIDPTLEYASLGPGARRARLSTLASFLHSVDDDPKYQVAFYQEQIHQSVTILGDWFYAESISSSIERGFLQTIFTRHAPSMQAKIDLFDREFSDLLVARKWTAETSRLKAVEHLEKLLNEIA
jgi:hypothetical protein